MGALYNMRINHNLNTPVIDRSGLSTVISNKESTFEESKKNVKPPTFRINGSFPKTKI
jgi:hypothetical protein